MKNFKIIKENPASPKEVFDNLKYAGLKLLCFNEITKLWSQVSYYDDNTIEIITIKDDKRYSEYFQYFPYHDLFQLKANTNFFKDKTWWLGYIEESYK